MSSRYDIKAILNNPKQRRELMVQTIIATQAREGVETTREQAEEAYDAIQKEKATCKQRNCKAVTARMSEYCEKHQWCTKCGFRKEAVTCSCKQTQLTRVSVKKEVE